MPATHAPLLILSTQCTTGKYYPALTMWMQFQHFETCAFQHIDANRLPLPLSYDLARVLHSELPVSAASPGRQGSHVKWDDAPVAWLAVPAAHATQVSGPVAPRACEEDRHVE